MSPKGQAQSPEHRAKIAAALKAYNARPDAHLRRYRKAGAEHPNWKGGSAPRYYRRIARAGRPNACQRCGAGGDLLVHHIDRDRRHNDADNLEILCRACHMREHHGKRVDWPCPVCGRVLNLQPFWAARRRFCSRQCKETSRDEYGRFAS